MCGIAGHVSFHNSPSSDALECVVQNQFHRGPDHRASWQDEHAALGHTRLAIIDLSPTGHQPMIDAETGNVIVYNGEVYNFQALRADLEARGHKFASTSDTEVILALYRRYGEECVTQLRGMFAFAIWNPRKRELLLSRDRAGKKPLVYAETTQGFLFASEIGALAAHPLVSKDIDPQALELYLTLQYIPAPWTIYQAIRKLPPAHFGVLTAKGLRLERYWNLDYTRKRQISEEEAEEAVLEELTEAVRLRLISDVPLGALLSGGVDSSLVVAIMSRLSSRPVKTFSVGFEDEGFNELPHARAVAQHLGTEHHEEVLTPNVAEMLPSIVRQYGEPYADKSALPSFVVAEMTRQHVTVALSGDGGDELAAGYDRYRTSRLMAILGALTPGGNGPADARKAESLLSNDRLLNPLRRRWAYQYVHPELQSLAYRDFFHGPHRQALLKPEVRAASNGTAESWKQRWLDEASCHASNAVERMMWIDNLTYLPGDLLVKIDIAAMAYALEVRSPLLDHKLVELCATLPAGIKARNGETKRILKRLAARFVPSSVIYRPKHGFSVPVSAWLRGPMQGFLKNVLADTRPQLGVLLQTDQIDRLVEQHTDGVQDHGGRLWALLNLALWLAQKE